MFDTQDVHWRDIPRPVQLGLILGSSAGAAGGICVGIARLANLDRGWEVCFCGLLLVVGALLGGLMGAGMGAIVYAPKWAIAGYALGAGPHAAFFILLAIGDSSMGKMPEHPALLTLAWAVFWSVPGSFGALAGAALALQRAQKQKASPKP
ncbi:MAG TPA: hypothetical protein VG013_28765 [Gemmataceae bacterium]|jgi:hypothetical protein|nr:hypothetical protein [Gemmataceae bacterium]